MHNQSEWLKYKKYLQDKNVEFLYHSTCDMLQYAKRTFRSQIVSMLGGSDGSREIMEGAVRNDKVKPFFFFFF